MKFLLGFYISGFGGIKSGFSGFGVFVIGFLDGYQIGDKVLIFFLGILPKVFLSLCFILIYLWLFLVGGFRLLKL